jgi:hypothetical protein
MSPLPMRPSPPAVYSGSDTLISMRVRKFYVIDLCFAGSSAEPQGNAQRLKLLHPVKHGGERLIVCARRAKKHAGRARHAMRAFFCLNPGTLRQRRYSKPF